MGEYHFDESMEKACRINNMAKYEKLMDDGTSPTDDGTPSERTPVARCWLFPVSIYQRVGLWENDSNNDDVQ